MQSAPALALLPDGNILLAGTALRPGTGFDLSLVRLTSDGQPDPRFGNQGRAELALGGSDWQEIVSSLATPPDGSFYVGVSDLPPGLGPSQVALTRFTPS